MNQFYGNEPEPQVQMPQLPKGAGKTALTVLILLIVGWIAFTMFFTVQEYERAAILTFGKYSHEVDAGLHFKFPYPIQEVIILPANKTQRIFIGYREEDGEIIPVDEEAFMITGDENIVSADAVVEWRISDIKKFLYNIEPDKETMLRNSASSVIRSVIGSTKLDTAITDGKTEVQAKVKEKLIALMDTYDSGIQVLDVKFQDIEPPGGEVQAAFKEVTNAREEKNTKVNNAKKYENDTIPKARGEAQALIENAEAAKKSRILNAQGDVAKFNAVYAEYIRNKDVTRQRLVVETIEKVLPNAKVILTDSGGDTIKYLPINELFKGSGANAASGAGSSTNVPKGDVNP